jgi:hypothetical protein
MVAKLLGSQNLGVLDKSLTNFIHIKMTQSYCVTDIHGHILNKQGGYIGQPNKNVGFTPRGPNHILCPFEAV